MSQRQFTVHPLVVRRLTVLAVHDVTPRMRRVTLGGPELGAFTRDGLDLPAFVSTTFDDHVKVLLASEGPLEDVLPRQLAHGIEWTTSSTRVDRDYTPRRVTSSVLELDFVIHSVGRDHAAGPAEAWARSAIVGAELAIVGPKSSTVLPADVDHVVLVADETGLPAVGRFLETRPVDAPVTVIASIGAESARQDLPVRLQDELVWVVAEPGDGESVMAAVRALDADLWSGRPYVWAGAEARSLLPLRRLVAREHAVPKGRIDITGYWHRRDRGADDATAEVADDASAGQATAVTLPSTPVAWLALRAALQLGLLDAIDGEQLSREQVEGRLGLVPGGLAELVGVLCEESLVREDAGVLALAEPVLELLADEHGREELDGPGADAVLALADLATALRGGTSAWAVRFGQTLAASSQDDAELAEELEHEAEGLAYLMPGLVALALWKGVCSVAVSGPGRAPVLSALRDATSAQCREVDDDQTPGTADVLVEARSLSHRTDEEARDHLARRVGVAPALVLVEPTSIDALAPGAAGEALVQVARTGTGPRSVDRLGVIAADAGWTISSAHDLGWGVSAVVLVPAEMGIS